jgi:hypothetical protein
LRKQLETEQGPGGGRKKGPELGDGVALEAGAPPREYPSAEPREKG